LTSYPERFSESNNSVFNSAVDGNKFVGIETTCGGNVDHYTAFLVIVLSHVLERQQKSSNHSVLENIKMHCVRNFESDLA